MTPEPTTTPVESPHRMPASKRVVVGGVAALGAIAGLVIAVFLLLQGGGTPASASWIPADALLYVDLQGDLSGGQRQAVGAFLDRFNEMPDDPLDGGLARWIDEQLEAGGVDYRYDADIGSWFNGQFAFALLHAPVSTGAIPRRMAPPDFVALAGVKDAAAAAAFLDRVRADAGETGTEYSSQDYEGTTIWWSAEEPVDPMGGGPPGAFATVAEQVIFGADADAVKAVLDTHAGRRTALDDRDEFTSMLAEIPGDRVFTLAIDGRALFEAQRSEIETTMPEFGDLYGALDFTAVFGVAGGRFEADRLILNAVAERPQTEATVANGRRTLADSVPANAMLFVDGGNVGETLAEMIGAVKAALPPKSESPDFNAEMVEQIEAILGNELESFVAWADDTALIAGTDGDEPYFGVLIRPLDADEARARLDQLQGLIQLATLDPSLGLEVEESEHDGAALTTIRLGASIPDAGIPPFSFQWAVTDELVVIALGEALATQVLDLDPAASLGQSERFTSAVARVGGSDNLSVTWLDAAAIRAGIEPILPPDLGLPYEEMIRPWVEPFDYLAGVSRLEGERIVSRAEVVVR
jgi:hypothetical protein